MKSWSPQLTEETFPEHRNKLARFDAFPVITIGLEKLILSIFSKSEDARESFNRRQEVMDNVLAEVLLYPTILCSLIGIAVETPFLPENFSPTIDSNTTDPHLVIWERDMVSI